MDERIEIRCPGRFRKLFLVLTEEFLPEPGKYMEISCSDCTRDQRKSGREVRSVLHYYDGSGSWVNTKVVR